MGEDVSKLWTLEEQKKFKDVVRIHAKSFGQSSINSALECLPCQSRETIVNYHLNVHILRRIAKQTRLGSSMIGTDDELEEAPPTESSSKRFQANHITSSISKYAKTKYLMGQRRCYNKQLSNIMMPYALVYRQYNKLSRKQFT